MPTPIRREDVDDEIDESLRWCRACLDQSEMKRLLARGKVVAAVDRRAKPQHQESNWVKQELPRNLPAFTNGFEREGVLELVDRSAHRAKDAEVARDHHRLHDV